MRPGAPITKPLWGARRVASAVAGYLTAVGCLYWIFHDVNRAELIHSLGLLSWRWLAPAIALDLGAYFLVAWQWQLLLRPVGHLGFREAARAVFAGRFANDVLPVQLGYLVRIYIAARDLATGFAAIIPSLLVERLLDGAWLGLGILSLTFVVPLPAYVITARNILGIIVAAGAVAVVIMAVRQKKADSKPRADLFLWRPAQALLRLVGRVMDGISAIARSRVLLATVLLAALKLVAQGLAYHAVVRAYGLDLPVWKGLAVFLIAYLGITVPSTPASVGVFQFFSVIGLELFGISKTTATGLSLVAFVVLTAPLALAGFYAVTRTGMKWRQLRSELGQLAGRMQAGTGSSGD